MAEKKEQKEEERAKEDLMKLTKRVEDNSYAIRMARVPQDTVDRFKDWANEEYCGDYGMAFKALMDGVPNEHQELLHQRIDALTERVVFLEQLLSSVKSEESDEDETKYKTMADGTKKRVKK